MKDFLGEGGGQEDGSSFGVICVILLKLKKIGLFMSNNARSTKKILLIFFLN